MLNLINILKQEELATLLSKWRALHWPLETTTQWKYHDIFEVNHV